MKLGILKADIVKKELSPQFGEYPDMFENILHQADSELELVVYDVQKGHYPQDINEVDAYLITGSAASVYEDKQWIKDLMNFVKMLHKQKKKLIGVCFGHQLIAHALGGKTEASPKGWNIGVQEIPLTEAGKKFTNSSNNFLLIHSHKDQVVQSAPGTTILAGTEFCPNAMFSIGDHIFSIQGHPEFQKEYARQLYNMRKEKFGAQLYNEAIASLELPSEQLKIAQWIVDFIRPEKKE